MNGDDDYDFTSTGGNYYQPGRRAYKPLELPSVDWRARWREEKERAEKAEAERDAAQVAGWPTDYTIADDMVALAVNCIQHLKNVRDGISSIKEAIVNMEECLDGAQKRANLHANKIEQRRAELHAAWCAGQDAAAEIAERRVFGWDDEADLMVSAIAAAIRVLTTPEDKP
jgi:hypothetical protein